MSLIKRMIPAAAKDFGKRFFGVLLQPLGWKLAPLDSQVLEGSWYASPVDGVVSQHRPLSIDDPIFREGLKRLASADAFKRLDRVLRDEEVIYRLYLAGQLAQTASRLPGDFVEFGTFRGATAYCMLQATAKTSAPKPIYLYDTFSGIPSDELTLHEKEVGLGGLHQDTSVERVSETLAAFRDRVRFRPGKIPATLDDSGPAQIAMMHVDLNLAAPTADALHWAWPRLSRGGICLLDDYLWQGFEDQRRCVDDFFHSKQQTIIGLPTGQGLVLNLN